MVNSWKPLSGGQYRVIDLCCGDGRIGEAFRDHPHVVDVTGCDLVVSGAATSWAVDQDVFEFLQDLSWEDTDPEKHRLFVSNPPFGSADKNRLTLQDRILREVAGLLQPSDEVIWLLPDLARASATRMDLWQDILGYPLRQYQIPFRTAFERVDGVATVGAASSVTWWNWVKCVPWGYNTARGFVPTEMLTLQDLGIVGGAVPI